MGKEIYSVIKGSGIFLPETVVPNSDFLTAEFFKKDGTRIEKENGEVIAKFQEITEIEERRYVKDAGMLNSDMATKAAEDAIKSSGIDPETLDYIITAHNFGNVRAGNIRCDFMPTIAARVKQNLGIENPYCVANDVPFGCPGWVQAMIQADYFIKSGDAKRILVIGTEMLSRVIDPHDMDRMIFSDGAGAVILEGVESEEPVGMLSHLTRSDVLEAADYLTMDTSFNPEEAKNDTLYVRMQGHSIYQYALTYVPQLVKDTIDKADLGLKDISKVLIHQANAKMDHAILKRIFRLYGEREVDDSLMPMTIQKYGNNSVATVPIMYDHIMKGVMPEHQLNSGDNVVFASVGAGMNINAFTYRMP